MTKCPPQATLCPWSKEGVQGQEDSFEGRGVVCESGGRRICGMVEARQAAVTSEDRELRETLIRPGPELTSDVDVC
jgi:hypothetical protein